MVSSPFPSTVLHQLTIHFLILNPIMYGLAFFDPQSIQSARLSMQLSELGLPTPLPATARDCCSPPWVQGGGRTHLRGRGWRTRFRRWARHCGTLGTLYCKPSTLCPIHVYSRAVFIFNEPAYGLLATCARTTSLSHHLLSKHLQLF